MKLKYNLQQISALHLFLLFTYGWKPKPTAEAILKMGKLQDPTMVSSQ